MEVILCDVLCGMKTSELESRGTLAYKCEVVSSWRDCCSRIYLYVEDYAFCFILRL